MKTWDLQWFHYREEHQATVTLFHSHYDDRIENQPVNLPTPGQFVQRGSVEVWGLEMEDKWQMTEQDRLHLGFTWQHNQDHDGVDDVTHAPRAVWQVGYVRSFGLDSSFSLYHQCWDEFKGGESGANPEPESHQLLSANLRYSLQDWLGADSGLDSAYVVLYGYNLLDEEIRQPELVVDPPNTIQTYGGRALYLSLELAW